MKTQEKIRKLEQNVTALWNILDDERLWHPSVIQEIQRRSRLARKAHQQNKLKPSNEVFASLYR